jgi:hypothetical protein
MPRFSVTSLSKIYRNWDFWFENKPSGNPDLPAHVEVWKFNQRCNGKKQTGNITSCELHGKQIAKLNLESQFDAPICQSADSLGRKSPRRQSHHSKAMTISIARPRLPFVYLGTTVKSGVRCWTNFFDFFANEYVVINEGSILRLI